jgi:hypothetical protein
MTARQVDIGLFGTRFEPVFPMRVRSFPRRIRMPMIDSSAGVKDVAMRMAKNTATAPTVPIRPRNGMPVMLSASRATMTVAPANTTALPDVPFASPIDSWTPMPCFSWVRWRFRMNSE